MKKTAKKLVLSIALVGLIVPQGLFSAAPESAICASAKPKASLRSQIAQKLASCWESIKNIAQDQVYEDADLDAILTGVAAAIALPISSRLTSITHELGHFIPALIFGCKPRLTLGHVGKDLIKAGPFCIKSDFFFHCQNTREGGSVRYITPKALPHMVIGLGGPVAGALSTLAAYHYAIRHTSDPALRNASKMLAITHIIKELNMNLNPYDSGTDGYGLAEVMGLGSIGKAIMTGIAASSSALLIAHIIYSGYQDLKAKKHEEASA